MLRNILQRTGQLPVTKHFPARSAPRAHVESPCLKIMGTWRYSCQNSGWKTIQEEQPKFTGSSCRAAISHQRPLMFKGNASCTLSWVMGLQGPGQERLQEEAEAYLQEPQERHSASR